MKIYEEYFQAQEELEKDISFIEQMKIDDPFENWDEMISNNMAS